MTRSAFVVLALAAFVAEGAALAQPKGPGDPPVESPEAQYTLHMKNGIQLYELKHYGPAIIEFDAAYAAKPSASPLINKALCYREQMKYPQAIDALKKALAEHGATLDPATKAAAQKAIDEMTPLIAYVELKVDPADAVVRIDDELVPAGSYAEIALGPNEHVIVVTRATYDTFTDRFTVSSGQHKKVDVALVSRMGTLEVFAPKDDVEIELDGNVVGRGHWSGPVEQGNHAVRFGTDQDAVSVATVAKQDTVLDRRAETPKPDPKPEPKPEPPKPVEPTGFFIYVHGGLLYPFSKPDAFSKDTDDENFIDATNNAGAIGGFRSGYRINTYVAFEGGFDYSNVTAGRSNGKPGEYSFSSWRIGPFLRLMSPGRIARFVGAVGGGLAFHTVSFSALDAEPACTKNAEPICEDSWGVDFFVTADAGVEFNIGHAILGLRLELTIDGTKGSNDYPDDEKKWPDGVGNPFDKDPVAFLGPIAHFGYSQW